MVIYSVDQHELLPGVSHLDNPGICNTTTTKGVFKTFVNAAVKTFSLRLQMVQVKMFYIRSESAFNIETKRLQNVFKIETKRLQNVFILSLSHKI